VYRVSDETYKEWTRRAEPRPGDLILAREAPAGNVAVIPEGMKLCLGQRTVLLRPKRNLFESAYLAHLLLQKNSQQRLLAHSRGATVQHVNVKDIRSFKVSSLPSLQEQRSVIERVKVFAEEERRLEGLYLRKLAALDELKQSLLHQAFNGQL
jgi:type I restriction enzyme S subunit